MNDKIREGLKKLGFTQLTQPQKKAIPIISSGQNCLIIAPTGYGKTEAALLPLLDWVLENKPQPVPIVYITPLKALNRDLLDRMEFWENHLDINIAVRHGDTPQSERRKQMRNKPDILITTPEMFQGLLPSAGEKLFSNTKWVVVDEIHELLDNKRGYQLAVGLERLKLITSFKRIGLSATVRNPGLAGDFLRGSNSYPEIVEVDETKPTQLIVDSPKPVKKDYKLAKKHSSDPEVMARLRKIAELEGSTLIFSNTRQMSEMLGSQLNNLVPTRVHHSSLSKHHRIGAEKSFKKDDYKALVATSSMELGIDIGSVETVVQYNSPRQVLRLIQRVGRSGHSWDRIAQGLLLSNQPQDILESAVIAAAAEKKKLEPVNPEPKPLDVLAHQIVGIMLQKKEIEDAYSVIKGAQPFRSLKKHEFDEVVQFLQSIRLISKGLRKGSFKYYYSNLSTIPDSQNYNAVNMVDGKSFAVLDEEFVSSLDKGMVFICAGRFWQLVDVDPTENKVLVEPARDAHHAPAWVGELIPVSSEIASNTMKLKNKLWNLSRKSTAKAIDYFVKNYPVTRDAAIKAITWAEKMDWPEPAIEIFDKFAFIHVPFGSKANEALGRLLAGFFSLKLGHSVGMKSTQYRIMLEFPAPVSGELIRKVLSSINTDHVEANLTTIIRHTPLFKHRFVQIAKRFGVVSRGAELNRFRLKRLIEVFQSSPIEQETLKEIFNEKLDLKTLTNSIHGLRELKVREGPSPMAMSMLEDYAPELIGLKPESEILKALEKRLEKRRFNLKCLYCKEWEGTGTPLTAPDRCPNCGAGLLAVLSKFDNEKGERLSAELYLNYGKDFLLALAGRGVGPETAKRVMAKGIKSKKELLRQVMKAEKNYARTKRFWDT